MPLPTNQFVRYLPLAANVTKDGSNYISQVNDIGDAGNNYHLIGTGTAKPLWVDSVLNGNPVMRFDGINDYLKVTFGATYAQPFTIYLIFKINSSTLNQYALDGVDSTNRIALYTNGNILGIGAFTTLGYSKTNPFSDFIIVECIVNSTTSTIYENAYLRNSGDCGTRSLAGITVGINQGLYYPFLGDIAEIIYYNRVLTDVERFDVHSYIEETYDVAKTQQFIKGLTFQTFDYQYCEFYMDAFCINVFDFPYISNEIYAITMQELTRSRPLIQTDKRMLINPTPDKDIPASIYIDDKLYMNITPDNKRPTELK